MSEKPKGPSKAMKPDGRLARPYRIMWCDDSGGGAGDWPTAHYVRKAVADQFRRPGRDAGRRVCGDQRPLRRYTLSYPTEVEGMEFIVDRLEAGAIIGGGDQWRLEQNLRHLWVA